MPRKPNYKFERMERDRAKANKKALRAEAKKEKAERKNAEATANSTTGSEGETVTDPPADDSTT